MKQKQIIFITAFLISVFCLTGCGEREPDADSTPVPAGGSAMRTLTIYSINSDTMTLIPVTAKISEEQELSAYYIATLVLDNLDEDDIGIDYIKKKGKTVIVSFSAGGKPVKNCNQKMENLILEAFSSSLIDNVKGCEKIIFRCEDKAYRSSQHSFGRNEVYVSA